MAGLLAGVGTALTVVFLMPQMARVLSRSDIRGLSPAWAAFGTLTNLAWLAYLGSQGLWAATVAPLIAVLAYSITLRLIVTRTIDRRWVGAALLYAITLMGIVAVWGWAGLGIVLALTPIVQLTPGVMAAYRTRVPSAVSPLTWALMVVEAIMWGGYGLLTGDMPLIGYGVITVIGSGLILARCWVTRPRIRLTRPLVEV